MKSLDPQLKSVLPGMQAHGAETGSRHVSPMLAWALIVAAWAALLFCKRPSQPGSARLCCVQI